MSLQTEFLKAFTQAIISTYKINQPNPKKEVVNGDMIPSISADIFRQKNLIEKRIQPSGVQVQTQKKLAGVHIKPAQKNAEPLGQTQKFTAPAPPDLVPSSGEYGKITYLIKDSSVTLIECPGEGQPVSIFRMGQKQTTKIVLSNSEIKDFLQKTAEKAHVPLIEGVFKAAVDNFLVNAVFSSVINSKFMIKKQTPYSLISPKD
jgi:hypothetical protein